MSSPRRLPVSRTVHCVCGRCPRWPPASWSARFSPTTSMPTRCSRTSDCAESDSASCIPRSMRDSGKSSELSMSSGLEQPVTATGIGESFDTVVVPHLDAGYRLARWLVRDEHDAEDVVQEASLRALRYFRTFDGGDGRAWFLRIVRNTCYGWQRHGSQAPTDPFDEEQHSSARPPPDPETLL